LNLLKAGFSYLEPSFIPHCPRRDSGYFLCTPHSEARLMSKTSQKMCY